VIIRAPGWRHCRETRRPELDRLFGYRAAPSRGGDRPRSPPHRM